MRKIIMIALLLLGTLPAAAQLPGVRLEWGVIGGVNVPDFTTNMDRTEVKNKLGWQVGMVTAVKVGIIAIEPQILYVRQGLRIRPEAGARSTSSRTRSTCRCSCRCGCSTRCASMPVRSSR